MHSGQSLLYFREIWVKANQSFLQQPIMMTCWRIWNICSSAESIFSICLLVAQMRIPGFSRLRVLTAVCSEKTRFTPTTTVGVALI